MQIKHSQSDRATSSTFRRHFEIGRWPGLGLEARQESHWKNRRTGAVQRGDVMQCLSSFSFCMPPKQL